MVSHSSLTPPQLRKLIRSDKLTFAGNQRLRIYGRLSCSSGKRMKRETRIFFADEAEALTAGYRPCAHCMGEQYLIWKKITGSISRI